VSLSRDELLNQAIQSHEAGELGRAETLYREVLRQSPKHPDALHLLGLLAHRAGRLTEAAGLIRQALTVVPESVPYLCNLGEILRADGAFTPSLDCLRRAIQLDPGYSPAHHNLGVALVDLRQYLEAAVAFHQATRLAPRWLEPRLQLVRLLIGARRLEEALEHVQVMVAQQPQSAEYRRILGTIFNELQRYPEAEAAFRQTVEQDPACVLAWNDLGAVCWKQHKTEEAAAAWRKAMEIAPGFDWPFNNYAGVLKDIGRVEEAVRYFRRSLQINPQMHAVRSNMLLSMHYSTAFSPMQIYQEHREWERQFHAMPPTRLVDPSAPSGVEESVGGAAATRPIPVPSLDRMDGEAGLAGERGRRWGRGSERPLRVGYVSADFRSHSVADFLESLWKNHRRGPSASEVRGRSLRPPLEMFAYSDVAHPDTVTERLRNYCDAWRDIRHLDTDAVVQLIRQDRIDILVDLAGHSANNRMPVFAMKPAPLQVTWLGYPDTTGLSTVAYRLTDRWADPEGLTESLHSEQLWRLPRGFLCFQPTPGGPDVGPLPSGQGKTLTLGCFNNFAKLNLPLMESWAEILRRLPDARLLLKATVLGQEYAKRAMQDYFDQAGLDAQRVQLIGSEPDFFRHLAWYHEVDLALDTFPYHGTTTTCEALWMGVPVITQAGKVHCSRVGVSLLHQVGLESLVAQDRGEYIDKAVTLAKDTEQLAGLRRSLRVRMQASSLLDDVGFTCDFETALWMMWQRTIESDHRDG
jgi:protein O-GlcNAc transferase